MTNHLEQSLKDLEHIVEQLEKGDLPLDESLALFEKGIKLTKGCQKTLSEAEQKIQTITDDSMSAEAE